MFNYKNKWNASSNGKPDANILSLMLLKTLIICLLERSKVEKYWCDSISLSRQWSKTLHGIPDKTIGETDPKWRLRAIENEALKTDCTGKIRRKACIAYKI